MKKLIIILTFLISVQAFAYQDLLEMIQLKKSVDAMREVEALADLRLWHLEQTKPRIFITIETADNATDIGYMRQDYYKSGKLGKLVLLKEYFNTKN